MIYNSGGYSLEVDLLKDLHNWAHDALTGMGLRNVREDALEQYSSMLFRRLVAKPRRIEKSKEFICPKDYKEGLRIFEEAVRTGRDLTPYMSKTIEDAEYDDGFLFDWSLFHFHLGIGPDTKNPRFVERTGPVLIAFINIRDDDIMYFVQIRNHSTDQLWYDDGLVRIVADNWPSVVEKYRMHGIASMTEQVTWEQRKQLRKNLHANVPVDLSDGRVFFSMNWGITAAGTSFRAMRDVDSKRWDARLMMEEIENHVDLICETINKKIDGDSFQITLVMPGYCDYTFKVVGAPVYIRLIRIPSENRFITCVGDDMQSIDRYLKQKE